MQKVILFFLSSMTLLSCWQTAVKKSPETKDTSFSSDEEITPDINQLRKEYILSYNKPVEFENESKGKSGEKIRIIGKYYCLFDSTVIVPPKYNYDDKTKSFITHNFAEDILITSNGDTVIKQTITKDDFYSKLPAYLQAYAVIFEPKFEGYDNSNDEFNFSFSISIPLTDIGQEMDLHIKRNGQITTNVKK